MAISLPLPILEELDAEFAALTDEELNRAKRDLGPMKRRERALGVVHRVEAQRLWAVSLALLYKASKSALASKFEAKTDDEAKESERQGRRYAVLAELARDIFWATAKDDIGGDAWDAGDIGIRDGFMLVSRPDESQAAAIKGLLGGFRLPPPLEGGDDQD